MLPTILAKLPFFVARSIASPTLFILLKNIRENVAKYPGCDNAKSNIKSSPNELAPSNPKNSNIPSLTHSPKSNITG